MWSSVRSQAGKCAIPEGFVISYNDFGNDVVGDPQDEDDGISHLGVEGDGALVDVLPVVALSRLHVDHLPIINGENNNADYDELEF